MLYVEFWFTPLLSIKEGETEKGLSPYTNYRSWGKGLFSFSYVHNSGFWIITSSFVINLFFFSRILPYKPKTGTYKCVRNNVESNLLNDLGGVKALTPWKVWLIVTTLHTSLLKSRSTHESIVENDTWLRSFCLYLLEVFYTFSFNTNQETYVMRYCIDYLSKPCF